MPSGRPKPSISQASVEAALNTLLYSTREVSSAATIHALAVVDQFLQHPARPPADELREYATKAILTEIIRQQYARFRRGASLPLPQEDTTRIQAARHIQQDSEVGSAELIGWSFLYHRFVRVDLGISQEDYAQMSNVEQRTLRRYKKHGIARLTDHLIEAEWAVRSQRHQQRIHAKLPGTLSMRLVGREAESAHVLRLFRERLAQTVVFVGAPGIGKSHLAAHVAHQLLDEAEYEYALWINAPESISQVYRRLRQLVIPKHADLELREALYAQRTLVVIDGVDAIATQAGWRELLVTLQPTSSILCASTYLPEFAALPIIPLRELSYAAVNEFLAVEFSQLDGKVQDIWNVAGGNPLALRLIAGQYLTGQGALPSRTSLDRLYMRLLRHFDEEARLGWLVVAVDQFDGIRTSTMDELRERGLVSRAAVEHLLRYFLIQHDPQTDVYRMPQSAKTFFRLQFASDPALQALRDILWQRLQDGLPAACSRDLWLIESLLQTTWVSLPDDFVVAVIRGCWRVAARERYAAVWWAILERYRESLVNPELRLAEAVFARKARHFLASQRLFEQVVRESGQYGEFAIQTESLLEYAVLLRLQGAFHHAQHMLGRIEPLAAQHLSAALRDKLWMEFSQLALERGDVHRAQSYLQRIQDTEVAALRLQEAEVRFLLGDYSTARSFATEAIHDQHREKYTLEHVVSAYTLIGRSYQSEHDVDSAVDYLNAALALAEQDQDVLHMARAQSNLAAVLIERADFQDAEPLLYAAQTRQERLQDRVGLAATQHNLQALQRARVTKN